MLDDDGAGAGYMDQKPGHARVGERQCGTYIDLSSGRSRNLHETNA
jgi:hypothetical protein